MTHLTKAHRDENQVCSLARDVLLLEDKKILFDSVVELARTDNYYSFTKGDFMNRIELCGQ